MTQNVATLMQHEYRIVYLYNYLRGLDVNECHEELFRIFSNKCPTKATVEKWYKQFENGDYCLGRKYQLPNGTTPGGSAVVSTGKQPIANIKHEPTQQQTGGQNTSKDHSAAIKDSVDKRPVELEKVCEVWLPQFPILEDQKNNFNLDLNGGDAASIMVNPNSVMPHMAVRSPTPSNHKRHFSFSPTKDVKDEKIDVEEENDNDNDNDNDTENEQYENDITESEEEEEEDEDEDDSEDEREILKAVAVPKSKSTLSTANGTVKTIAPQLMKSQAASKIHSISNLRVQNFKVVQSSNPTQHVRKQIYNNNVHLSNNATVQGIKREKEFVLSDYDEKPYPKPAYSYSCLIAMALKNSQTGSLPVSEIYNFMCQHFPYFKTAPSPWKNSVRHNLSLNKCFEKIEKPAGNGNQRKGCLWAINPEKVAKMDEEVQKWSRKDPLAIKKAMKYPDHLELLERGEMKYAGSGDMSEETESSGDETAEEGTTYDESVHSHVAANSVTDSYDESSQDCDVDMSENMYEEVDVENNKDALHMQLNISKREAFEYELSPSSKRQKTIAGTLHGNYVYQSVTTSRRKTPLLLRAGTTTGSFLKID